MFQAAPKDECCRWTGGFRPRASCPTETVVGDLRLRRLRRSAAQAGAVPRRRGLGAGAPFESLAGGAGRSFRGLVECSRSPSTAAENASRAGQDAGALAGLQPRRCERSPDGLPRAARLRAVLLGSSLAAEPWSGARSALVDSPGCGGQISAALPSHGRHGAPRWHRRPDCRTTLITQFLGADEAERSSGCAPV